MDDVVVHLTLTTMVGGGGGDQSLIVLVVEFVLIVVLSLTYGFFAWLRLCVGELNMLRDAQVLSPILRTVRRPTISDVSK